MDNIQVRTRQTTKNASDQLLEFVTEQIDKMQKYSQLGNGQPTFFELNDALSNWTNYNCSLIALEMIAKDECQKAKDAYEDFISEKYCIIRNENNLQSLAATKWLSNTELNYMVETDSRWNSEFRKLREEMNASERKVGFMRRILDSWEAMKFTLGTLSKNVQAESLNLSGARYLGIEQG